MKVVLAEKPSVAQSIARIVGATQKKDGFYEGNGWQVTYAFGHLIQLALPENYGYNSWSKGNLPMLPKEFLMIPRQKKEGKTYKNNPGVMKQLRIIKKLFEDADTIIYSGYFPSLFNLYLCLLWTDCLYPFKILMLKF